MVAIPLALLLAGLGGFFLGRKTLAPVVAMSEQARHISAENLKRRLPVANPRDELGQLAPTFNELLGRLDASFDLQRQFMADASHELRTPLSVMPNSCEVVVADTGEGIPVEAQPHIFDRFYRVDKARLQADINMNGAANESVAKAGGGAGLGLSIAQWVAEAHGGTIRLVRSDPAGTVFAIALPLRQCRPAS